MLGLVKKGETVVLPTAIVTYRDDRVYPGDQRPAVNWSEVSAVIDATTSPAPVPYSAQAGVGKMLTPIRRRAALNIADILSIRASEANGSRLVGRNLNQIRVSGSDQHIVGKLPVAERVNIQAPPQSTLSAQTVLKPDPTWAPAYAKLMG
jgi:hypothetical protein